MPRRAPPMEWSWIAPSSQRGTHPQPPEAGLDRVLCSASPTSPCVMCYNTSVVLAGVLAVHCQSRPPCPPCSCPRQSQRRPRQICPPRWFCECPPVPRQGRPLIAFASAVVRRLGQGRPPRRRVVCRSPAQGRPPSCFSECRRRQGRRRRLRQGSPLWPAKLFWRVPELCGVAVPARVDRRPRRPPSPPGSPAKCWRVAPSFFCACQSELILRVPELCAWSLLSTVFAGLSAVPARVAIPAATVARQGLVASARDVLEGRAKVFFGSARAPATAPPAKLILRVPELCGVCCPPSLPGHRPCQGGSPSWQGRPPSCFVCSAWCVPAMVRASRLESVVRRPRQGAAGPVWSLSSAVRVVRRPRQGRPPSSFSECQKRRPRQGRPPSCFSQCVPARVVRRPRQGRPPSSLKDVPAPPGFSCWEIRVPNFTIVPHN